MTLAAGALRAGAELEPARPPSFWDGVVALPHGLRFLWLRPRTWPAAAAPGVILLLLAGYLLWNSLAKFGPWLSSSLFPEASTWYEQSARVLVRWLSSAFAAYFGFLVALFLTPALSGPALERLVRAQEAALGAPSRPQQGFWFELRCGAEAQLWGWVLTLPLSLLAWIVASLVPGAALLIAPLQVLPLALALTWGLLDYPLTSRGVRVRARWALLRRAPAAIAGFALCLAGVTLIPGGAFVLLPAGVVGATRLTWRLLPETAGTS